MEKPQQRQRPPPPPLPGWRRRIRRIRKPADHPQQQRDEEKEEEASTTRNVFKSRKRFARELSSDKTTNDTAGAKKTDLGNEDLDAEGKTEELTPSEAVISERRKALFEPLEPNMYGQRPSAESLLPPPDFDAASYPKGWLIGKKRKLVNVDVVESMRRIAVQEMNRKDREIDGLNVQLEEDARVLEHLQIQLVEEKSKRSNVERENAMLQNQVNMLMDMLQNNDTMADDSTDEP